ncbi:MAG: hypothetical protein WEA04_02810 [Candidatus Andersenbacteria bacterium]
MTSAAIITIVVAVTIVAGSTALGTYYWRTSSTTPRPASVAISLPSVAPTPPASPDVKEGDEQTVTSPLVQGTSQQVVPSPAPSSLSVAISPPPAATDSSASFMLDFMDTPDTIRTGQSFTVRWRVTGPAGAAGEKTALKVSLATNSANNGSQAATTNNTTNSFGPFIVPRTFSSDFKFGNAPGTINVEITANIGGQELRQTKAIQLTPA